jgi:hypothetical protein
LNFNDTLKLEVASEKSANKIVGRKRGRPPLHAHNDENSNTSNVLKAPSSNASDGMQTRHSKVAQKQNLKEQVKQAKLRFRKNEKVSKEDKTRLVI